MFISVLVFPGDTGPVDLNSLSGGGSMSLTKEIAEWKSPDEVGLVGCRFNRPSKRNGAASR
jgi:hypothetical protein